MARSAPQQAVRQRAWSQAARSRSRDPAGRAADAAGRCPDAPPRSRPCGHGRGGGWGAGRFTQVRSPWTWSRLDRPRLRPATC